MGLLVLDWDMGVSPTGKTSYRETTMCVYTQYVYESCWHAASRPFCTEPCNFQKFCTVDDRRFSKEKNVEANVISPSYPSLSCYKCRVGVRQKFFAHQFRKIDRDEDDEKMRAQTWFVPSNESHPVGFRSDFSFNGPRSTGALEAEEVSISPRGTAFPTNTLPSPPGNSN